MSYRTILADLTVPERVRQRLDAAKLLAARFDARLIGMHIMPAPFVPLGFSGEGLAVIGPELMAAQRQANHEIKERVRHLFVELLGAHAKDVVWREAEGEPGLLLERAARTSDLVVTERAVRSADAIIVEQLILGAGVPVLVLPPDPVAGIGQRVLVGWNASCEATRAIHGALPFLVAAERVILCAVGRSAHADLDGALAMLQRHSVPVVPLALEEADASAGETLLIQCYAEGADLLVIGAYGHNRLREFIFGGATRQALHAAALPVLFSA